MKYSNVSTAEIPQIKVLLRLVSEQVALKEFYNKVPFNKDNINGLLEALNNNTLDTQSSETK